ncbi:hypothetical protein [Lacticaseibacillus absianus]|uniref:hypothetical protein n=1 Tax=Lacticaseibacillus absianus TaxID=2729623 RepID=UPI0015CBC0C4|nr:hypothetical protein [Lacticaseibacillus absianus]
MYEATKRRHVSEQVAAIFPQTVTDQIFSVIKLMNDADQLVTAPVALAFSDDYTDDELYALLIQGNLAPAQEFPISYDGDKSAFLGHGYILIVKDNPKAIYIDFSKANDLSELNK